MSRLILWAAVLGLIPVLSVPAAVVRAWATMHRWPQQTVHYYIDQSAGNWIHKLTEQPTPWTYDSAPKMWGETIEQTIKDGLAILTDANPGMRFVYLEKPDAKRFPHAVRIRERPEILITGMATANGFYNGRSTRYEIHINKWNHAGIVAHEMLHILGVSHAQSAANRETYAIVYTGQTYLKGTPNEFTVPDNVRSGHGNFNLLTGRRMLGGYDFNSIMHYSDSIMKKRGTKNPPALPMVTIGRRIKPGPLTGVEDTQPKTGIYYREEKGNGRSYQAQRSRLSAIDRWALREMYFHTTNPETGADYNGDGFADLIVGSRVIYGGVYGSESSGLDSRNVPNANKRLPFTADTGIGGDFNGDYRMDAAINTAEGIQVLYAARDNDGRDGRLGLLATPNRLAVQPVEPDCWSIGDFNGDGYSDLVLRVSSKSGVELQLHFGSLSGLKTPSRLRLILDRSGRLHTHLAAGDFNGDGYTDLAMILRPGQLHILRGSDEGLSQTTQSIEPIDHEAWTGPMAVGDFNCDGVQDLAVGAITKQIVVFHGERRGSGINSDGQSRMFVAKSGSVLLAADLNGDGFSDLAIGNPADKGTGSVQIIHGARSGLTPSTAEFIRPQEIGIAAKQFGSTLDRGDFDGNGYVDLVIGTRGQKIVRYNGSPYSGPKTVIGRSFPHHELLAD